MSRFTSWIMFWSDRLRRPRRWLPIAVIITGVLITVALYGTLIARQERLARMSFNVEVSERLRLLENRLQRIFGAIYSTAGFYQGSELVTLKEFQTFAEPQVERHPTLLMLFWAPRVPHEDRAAFEAGAEPVLGRPIQIREQTPEGPFITAKEQPFYFPIFYVWPPHEPEWRWGFNLASRMESFEAMNSARSVDGLVATRPFTHASELSPIRCVWVFHAVQRNALPFEEIDELEGFVGGAFRIDEMFEGLWGQHPPRNMIVEVRDRDAPPGNNLVYASHHDHEAHQPDAQADHTTSHAVPGRVQLAANAALDRAIRGDESMLYTKDVSVAGRRWQILALPTARYLSGNQTWTPMLLLGSGLGLSIVLGSYLHTVLERTEQVERKVDLRTEELRQEVEQRRRYAEQLNRTAHALERSNRELEQFAYIASHDLQEPLRKVRGFGDMLRTQAGSDMDPTALDYLCRMQDAAQRMQALIHGLLSYSRVTTKARAFERVDLNQIAREVVEDLTIRLRDTGGRVHVEDLPTIEADPVQMRQLLQNLISNGLKFHRKGVPPEVSVTREPPDERFCRIRVEDNGIGFEAHEAERLFEPFQRLHSRTRYEGTGIGLAVCQKIVERHGGTIVAESERSAGSIFTITLPYQDAREETHRAA